MVYSLAGEHGALFYCLHILDNFNYNSWIDSAKSSKNRPYLYEKILVYVHPFLNNFLNLSGLFDSSNRFHFADSSNI